MTKPDPSRYLVEDARRAEANRNMIQDKSCIECYPVYAEPENLREPTVEELLIEVLQDEEEIDKAEKV